MPRVSGIFLCIDPQVPGIFFIFFLPWLRTGHTLKSTQERGVLGSSVAVKILTRTLLYFELTYLIIPLGVKSLHSNLASPIALILHFFPEKQIIYRHEGILSSDLLLCAPVSQIHKVDTHMCS